MTQITQHPDITIVATTFFPDGDDLRYKGALKTIGTWQRYLGYDGKLNLHIADDGTEPARLVDFLRDIDWLRGSVTVSSQVAQGVGASLNAGFKQAYEQGDFAIYLCDDWALTVDFSLFEWVQMLQENLGLISMIRLGVPHPNLTGVVRPFSSNFNGWGLKLDRTGFAFATRPALFHRYFLEFYGKFLTNVNAMDAESDYAIRFAMSPTGPDIVLALPHPFQHIETIELGYDDPTKRGG